MFTEVVLEEQQSQGPSDSMPMSLYALYVMLEKQGVMDSSVTGHDVDRPPEVKRGEASDDLVVAHKSYSVYRPNPVQLKNVKSSNLGSFLGHKTLGKSQYLQMVWRNLDPSNFDICYMFYLNQCDVTWILQTRLGSNRLALTT